MHRPTLRWSAFAVVAMVVFLMAGLSFGRTSCTRTADCCTFTDSLAACISGSVTSCFGTCIGVAAAVGHSQDPAMGDQHMRARMVMTAGLIVQPELRPPRV